MRDFVEKGGNSGYIKLPTGTGKTVLFTEFVEALDLRTLIVVPTKLLVDQTEKRLEQFAPELDVGVVRSGRKKDLSKQCTVITYASFVEKLDKDEILSSDYDCLILDEVHMGLSNTRVNAINQFNNALKLGFTATPQYSRTRSVDQLLHTEIHRMSIREAVVEEGLLSGFQCILAKTDTDLSKVKIVGGEKYDEKELEHAVNNHGRNTAAIELYRKMFKGEMAVVYCAGIQHATDLAKMFNDQGVSAEVISGKTPEKERKSILARYDVGEIKVLCNSDLLIAGFDQPKASICLNLRPTLSSVIAEQRGGRVLRLNEEDEEKVAYIVDFIDKGHDPQHYPVQFAEVAEETALLRKGKLGLGRYKRLYIRIEGLNVETDSKKISELVRVNKKEREQKEKFLPWDKFLDEARHVFSGKEGDAQAIYRKEYLNHAGWPSNPDKRYAGKGWKTFAYLFGRDEQRFLPWNQFLIQAREVFRNKEGNMLKLYEQEYSKHLGWPSSPKRTYAGKGWVDLAHLFGRDERFFAWEEFLSDVRKFFKGADGDAFKLYQQEYKNHPRWPSSPHRTYENKGWQGYPHLFGRE
jgi:superfamily II DNA or RNA helicase